MTKYSLLDSGNGKKLERFGPYTIQRPASQAVWKPSLDPKLWKKADGVFTRDKENQWKRPIEGDWTIDIANITFKLSPTDFGHIGVFPEHQQFWKWIQKQKCEGLNILNLFAYSGGATLAAAKAGATVCHLDASKGMVTWARENTKLNGLKKAPIRWITDDAQKFLKREERRGNRYDAIILDPPSFGRGSRGEVFKIEDDILVLLDQCRMVLSNTPKFILFSCHTPGFSPLVMRNLMNQMMQGFKGTIDQGEMVLEGEGYPLPSGTFARWCHD